MIRLFRMGLKQLPLLSAYPAHDFWHGAPAESLVGAAGLEPATR